MKQITSLRVDYKHVDGWHVFSSHQIDGLYVASPDPECAYNDVATAIAKLLKLNYGIECNVAPEQSFSEFIKTQTAPKTNSRKAEVIPLRLSSQRFAVSACA